MFFLKKYITNLESNIRTYKDEKSLRETSDYNNTYHIITILFLCIVILQILSIDTTSCAGNNNLPPYLPSSTPGLAYKVLAKTEEIRDSYISIENRYVVLNQVYVETVSEFRNINITFNQANQLFFKIQLNLDQLKILIETSNPDFETINHLLMETKKMIYSYEKLIKVTLLKDVDIFLWKFHKFHSYLQEIRDLEDYIIKQKMSLNLLKRYNY